MATCFIYDSLAGGFVPDDLHTLINCPDDSTHFVVMSKLDWDTAQPISTADITTLSWLVSLVLIAAWSIKVIRRGF